MDKYGLIGYPLGHSFSKNYFNEKFENEASMPIHQLRDTFYRKSYRDSRLKS